MRAIFDFKRAGYKANESDFIGPLRIYVSEYPDVNASFMAVEFRFKQTTDYNQSLFGPGWMPEDEGFGIQRSCCFDDGEFFILVEDLQKQAALAENAGIFPNVTRSMIRQVQEIQHRFGKGERDFTDENNFIRGELSVLEPHRT